MAELRRPRPAKERREKGFMGGMVAGIGGM
jgi:hypothetical protein